MGNEASGSGSLYNHAYGTHQLGLCNGLPSVQKRYICGTAEERAALLGLISLIRDLDIPTIIRIYEAQHEQPSKQVVLWFEHCPNTLVSEIATKKATYFQYSQAELYTFIDCALSGLMALSFKKLNHRDLSPTNVLLGEQGDSKQRLYKIGCPLLMNPQTVEKSYSKLTHTQRQQQVYFGPQMFEAVSKLVNRAYSPEKNDVYSLGVIALQMATLEPISSIYNHSTGHINQLEVDKLLRVCRDRYSQKLTALLRDMLIYEDSHRPTFQEVFAILEPLLESNGEEQPLSPTAKDYSQKESDIKRQVAVSTTNIAPAVSAHFPVPAQRKIEVTSNKRIRVNSKPRPEISQNSLESASALAASQHSLRNSIHSRTTTSQLPTFCWVTEPSFLAELHVRRPYDANSAVIH